ncbi:redoxin domain-containing protein [Acidithiobacillus ferrooxidans]|uniref:redoxin domain-containing protein n=1 Tax=Acidithiobacillus ferrooxidans TaxID=920 RepID=UPI0027D25473|nr:redoxin domain-containing protein [Acidithiobacillus ferrooxidans]
MAMTAKELPIGSKLPEFCLPVGGQAGQWCSVQAQGKPLLVLFICNHCPYVIHISKRLGELTRQWQQQGVQVVGINSNDARTYPKMRRKKCPSKPGAPDIISLIYWMQNKRLPRLLTRCARRIFFFLMLRAGCSTTVSSMRVVPGMICR